ncbi:MAG: Rieske (2Fe-2S) protein [Bryobacterales bacterium]|nr:Rieske (2Fe-2S) protein [Acidobacteriota bacterium]MCB9386044.1 Rieske (2Fe-2S) protein [Bryobacterales bacterium]
MLRREFHSRAIFVLNAVIGAALALPAAAYLLLPGKRKRAGGGWSDAGSVSSLTEQPRQAIIQRKRVDGWKTTLEEATAWVFKRDGKVTAFSPSCPHLGCGVSFKADQGGFYCPCHDSAFSIDGKVLTGPSPRPLDEFETKIEGDRLWLGSVRRSDEA